MYFIFSFCVKLFMNWGNVRFVCLRTINIIKCERKNLSKDTLNLVLKIKIAILIKIVLLPWYNHFLMLLVADY